MYCVCSVIIPFVNILFIFLRQKILLQNAYIKTCRLLLLIKIQNLWIFIYSDYKILDINNSSTYLLENFEALGSSIVSAFCKIDLANLSLSVAVDFPAISRIFTNYLKPLFRFSLSFQKNTSWYYAKLAFLLANIKHVFNIIQSTWTELIVPLGSRTRYITYRLFLKIKTIIFRFFWCHFVSYAHRTNTFVLQ